MICIIPLLVPGTVCVSVQFHLIDQISAESQTLYTRESQTHVGFTILLSDLIDGMVCGNDLLLAYP